MAGIVMHKNMFTRTSAPGEAHDIIAPHSRRRVFERVAHLHCLLEAMQAGMKSCSGYFCWQSGQ